jgi:hypothetical protein
MILRKHFSCFSYVYGAIYHIVIYIKISRRGKMFYVFIFTFSRWYRMIFIPIDLGGQISEIENIVNMIMRTNIIIRCETKEDIWS